MVGMRNSNVYHGFHCLYLVLVSFLVIFFLVFCLLLRSCGMKLTSRSIRLLLLSSGLLGGLSDFSGTGFFLGDGLDDSDGHRLPHIADGEATKRRVVDERFHRQRLGRRHLHNSRVTVLDSFGESLELFSGTAIASTGGKVKLFFIIIGRPAVEESVRSALWRLDTAMFNFRSKASHNSLFQDLLELAGDVSRVAIEDRRVSVLDFSGVIQNNDLQNSVNKYVEAEWYTSSCQAMISLWIRELG